MKIGELARRAGVPTSTVRYYEREGLLRPRGRSAANYRIYEQADLERLRFIRGAQAIGLTLGDVRQLLRPAPCGRVQTLIEERLERVSQQMAELRHVRKVLREALATCQEHAPSGRCRVVEELSEDAQGGSARTRDAGRPRG